MKYCTECLLPDTKPDLWFTEDGVCAACMAFKNRVAVNWEEKLADLVEILEWGKKKSKSKWDCIIPVSGGKDSTKQVLVVKDLGFNPLCVVSTTCDLSEYGEKNIRNLNNLGVDIIEFSPNPHVRRRLNRIGLETVGDISWPEHLGIFTTPVRIAVHFEIPLLIWGENSQNEYGGPTEAQQSRVLDRRWLEEFGGLLGMRVGDLVRTFGFTESEVEFYQYPSTREIEELGVKGIFLGQFVPWDGFTNSLVALNHGFSSYHSVIEGSFVNYENLDNLQAGIHDYFKYLKFGFGRASDLASMYIRRGRIPREQAVRIVRLRDGMYPSTYLGVPLSEILGKIGLTIKEFNEICDRYTNLKLFARKSNGQLERRADGSPKLVEQIK